MGHRLSKIYTRTGDDGTTGLGTGERVDKCDVRIEACGSVDETNAQLGLLLAEEISDEIRVCLARVQNELFDLGAELSLPEYVGVSAEHVKRLERDLDAFNANLPPLAEFVLPGGNRSAAVCHVARTVCRRAERAGWLAAKQHPIRPAVLQYLNRLSDLLFVIARRLARDRGGREVTWQRGV